MTSLELLALADDLTGALEVGAKLAANGISSAVTTRSGHLLDSAPVNNQALVIDTETRHVSAHDAERIIGRLAQEACEMGVRYVYKKTDSTLRGNIADELAALCRAYPNDPLIYAPAYPEMGRTVRSGRLYADNVPVHQTLFASDEMNPVRESHIPTLLNMGGKSVPVISITADKLHQVETTGIYVLDGETEEDVREVAEIFSKSGAFHLAAGPASFMHHFAPLANLTRSQPAPWPKLRNGLVISGSRHERSLEQVAQARNHGWSACAAASIPANMRTSDWMILSEATEVATAGLRHAGQLGEIVRGLLRKVELHSLIVFGGDTAYGILHALGEPFLEPLGEVVTGVPLSRMKACSLQEVIGPRETDLFMITKAGGFGTSNILSLIHSRMAGTRRQG